MQSEELQIHAEEITDIRKVVEQEKLTRESLEKRLYLQQRKYGGHSRSSWSDGGRKRRHRIHHKSDIETPTSGGNTSESFPKQQGNITNRSTDANSSSSLGADADNKTTSAAKMARIEKANNSGNFDANLKQLTVQHMAALSELHQLRSKLTESLSDHHEMKRNIQELKANVSSTVIHSH